MKRKFIAVEDDRAIKRFQYCSSIIKPGNYGGGGSWFQYCSSIIKPGRVVIVEGIIAVDNSSHRKTRGSIATDD
eukprot:CAMPEP_0194126342 /NCGR_PEP_ID=MMETSP0150-20130528/59942_1 /TAXON_ID=122233 /ORGANISM="Chaetoceros debilis, Strain MM31A-1" /LENGTH=73 /DNA_ID=CAMNT_0038820199 /DNA_START=326 /DNA_END=547 /DNA_ORIENTATION=+